MNDDTQDAARYRWLRSQVDKKDGRADIYILTDEARDDWGAAAQIDTARELDLGIDALMKGENENVR